VNGVKETLLMTIASTFFAYLIGMPIGIALVITGGNAIMENKAFYSVLSTFMNILRSIPFLILLVVLIPFTRFLTGSSIGTVATIVPLTVGAVPIVARMVEASLCEVPRGIIETAKSMGASPMKTVTAFLIPESTPSLLLGATINLATVLGYSAMAGFIGGGGLGAIAIQYGYYRYQTEVLLLTVFILVIIVQLLQETGTRLANKKKHY
jgi:D-methionine transport system permease protein